MVSSPKLAAASLPGGHHARVSRWRLLLLVAFGGAAFLLISRFNPHPRLGTSTSKSSDAFQERDGLLFYDARASVRHPIYGLMENATRTWKEKVSRQSKTLHQAIAEYQRRYSRSPPVGFDKWFEYAQNVNFVLVDEFDRLFDNIAPFLATPGSVLRERSAMLAHEDGEKRWHRTSFTLHIKNGDIVRVSGPGSGESRARDNVELLQGFVEYLPDMDLTYTFADGPASGILGETRARLIDVAKAGEQVSVEEANEIQFQARYPPWAELCPPDSPMRRHVSGLRHQSGSVDSFIVDHKQNMDPCQHPEIMPWHGFTAWLGPWANQLMPLFTSCKTTMHSDLLAAPMEQFDSAVGEDPDWEDKVSDKLYWRGSNTGTAWHRNALWQQTQRARLVRIANDMSNHTRPVRMADEHQQLEVFEAPAHELSQRYFDIAFTGGPTQCDVGDTTCETLKEVFPFVQSSGGSQIEANSHKYIVDVDGSRFRRLLRSKSAILKSSIMPEWYMDHIQPWYHYIPLKVDYSDLTDIMAFFTGDTIGVDANDHLGNFIGQNGVEFAAKHWRYEDMEVYTFRLLLEYARALLRDDDDPLGMDIQLGATIHRHGH